MIQCKLHVYQLITCQRVCDDSREEVSDCLVVDHGAEAEAALAGRRHEELVLRTVQDEGDRRNLGADGRGLKCGMYIHRPDLTLYTG